MLVLSTAAAPPMMIEPIKGIATGQGQQTSSHQRRGRRLRLWSSKKSHESGSLKHKSLTNTALLCQWRRNLCCNGAGFAADAFPAYCRTIVDTDNRTGLARFRC